MYKFITPGKLTRREFMEMVEQHINGSCSWTINRDTKVITLYVKSPVLDQILSAIVPLEYSSDNARCLLKRIEDKFNHFLAKEVTI